MISRASAAALLAAMDRAAAVVNSAAIHAGWAGSADLSPDDAAEVLAALADLDAAQWMFKVIAQHPQAAQQPQSKEVV
jgi:hypothetical protein